MKRGTSIVLFFGLLIITACNFNEKNKSKDIAFNEPKKEVQNKLNEELNIPLLKEKAKMAKAYCVSQKLNADFYFLIDLKIHSGLKRFYIWDFKKDTIVNSFLVSHGCGKNPWAKDASKENAEISNEDGSHASSIGKYVIGKRGTSNWGIHINYLLDGKDKTNSNALQRQIVLHSWDDVPDQEIYPSGTPEGWGCPAVANSSMYIIDEKLKKSKKNVLLWVIK